MNSVTKIREINDSPFDTCQWLYGDEPKLRNFCGEPAVEGKPYCRRHCEKAYRPSIASEKGTA